MSQFYIIALLEKLRITSEQASRLLQSNWPLPRELRRYLEKVNLEGRWPVPRKAVAIMARLEAQASKDFASWQVGGE